MRQIIVTYTEVVTRVESFDVPDDFVPDSSSVTALVADGAGGVVDRMVTEYDLDGWSFPDQAATSPSVAELFV